MVYEPGLLFVAATLLPLASFVLLLLVGGLRFACRRYADRPGVCASIFNLLGGDTPAKWPAYVATAAIAAAFVLCLIGFIQFRADADKIHHLEHEIEHLIQGGHGHGDPHADEHGEKKDDHAKPEEKKLTRAEREKKIKELRRGVAGIEDRWEGEITWASLVLGDQEHLEKLEHELGELQAKKANATTETDKEKAQEEINEKSGQLNELKKRVPELSFAGALRVGYRIDHLNAVMFLMVTLIASLIHVFSMGYMGEELQKAHEDHQAHVTRRGRYGRFFLYLSLFCFSMLNLVLADNLFQVFLSWELVGICSFLLIGFYFERNSASTAANKAFITNRVGDTGFIIGLLILFTTFGTFNFEGIFSQVRAPLYDTHNDEVPVAGKIVRGEAETTGEGDEKATTFKIGPDAGSQVLLFPEKGLGHFHAEDFAAGSEVDVPLTEKANDHRTMPVWLLTLAGLGIFLGCVGKSAQFPLQVWLPDAMEGPTPVSALIHAATMVAAGVYLVGRVFPIFTLDALLVIAYTGGITLFVAATIAIVQTDIKKVLAYSTVSQLGYMMLALGVGGWVAGLFHLVTHAFFKALLFLCSGAVIYNCHHEQDMRKMGGLCWKMPITALTMLMGVLAIAGTPLFSGWYSKDAMLAAAFGFVVAPQNNSHFLLFLLPLVTAGITTFYMFRMWFMTFTGKPKDEHVHSHAKESPWVMLVPLIVLAVFSVFVAWGFPPWDAKESLLEKEMHHAQPAAVQADFGSDARGGDHPFPTKNVENHGSERANALTYHDIVGILALLVVAVGLGFALALYYYKALDPEDAKQQAPGLHAFLWNKWYFDELYSAALVRPALVVGAAFKWFDLNVIDGIIHGLAWLTVRVSKIDGWFDNNVVDGLVNLTARTVYGVGGWFRTFQTGYLRSYVLFLVVAAVLFFVAVSYLVARVMAG